MKKALSFSLIFLILLQLYSCGDNNITKTDSTDTNTTSSSQKEETDLTYVCEIPENVRFDGETFTFAIYENPNVDNHMFTEDETGDTMNDAKYKRQMLTEERFGITMNETVFEDISTVRNSIMASDNEFDIANVRCSDALSFWEEGLITSASELPYVDIDKGYWNKSFNESLTLGGEQYVIIGDMLTSTLDLTYTLTFNKKVAEDYKVGDIYGLVRDGKWTFDEMFSMMKTATNDTNGDTTWDINDTYGYVSSGKQVLPAFWIAAGKKSVEKDSNDLPYLAIGEESFIDVITKVFAVCYDDGTYYKPQVKAFEDVTDDQITLFTSDHALFMDSSFYYIQQLRSMDTDFGILPYPKYDENQDRYYSRVSYYNAPIVPVTNNSLDKTGAVLEYFNYVSHETVIPAYKDNVLYGKIVRDEESRDMLDIIFDSRVVDIGDTTLCSTIRDGVFRGMFMNDDRDIASKIPSLESTVTEYVNKIPN